MPQTSWHIVRCMTEPVAWFSARRYWRLDYVEYFCSCGEKNPDNCYGSSKTTCSKCHNIKTAETGKNNRLFAVECLGGKCAACVF